MKHILNEFSITEIIQEKKKNYVSMGQKVLIDPTA